VQRFRGGLVFKADRLVCHSTLGLRVIKKKKKKRSARQRLARSLRGSLQVFLFFSVITLQPRVE